MSLKTQTYLTRLVTPAHSTFSSVASLPFLVIIQKSIVEELPVLSLV
jgi:hypothetical protein